MPGPTMPSDNMRRLQRKLPGPGTRPGRDGAKAEAAFLVRVAQRPKPMKVRTLGGQLIAAGLRRIDA